MKQQTANESQGDPNRSSAAWGNRFFYNLNRPPSIELTKRM
jgi:hypothetical protein